jgi:hypothetical protein
MKTKDFDCKTGRPFSKIEIHRNENGIELWKYGEYNSEFGTVLIYHEPKIVVLSFHYRNRSYYRNIEGRNYTRIGLARIAGKFLMEILSR